MRERPNRTVSKTVVSFGHRGFKSHPLRHPAGPSVARPARVRTACGFVGNCLTTSTVKLVKVPRTATSVDADALLADALDRLAILVIRHRRDVVRGFDLTPPLSRALQRLDASAPCAMGSLAEVLECDPSNVTGIVDRLESRGLVERRAAEGDRRVKIVAVTAAGTDLLGRLRKGLATLPAEIAALEPTDRTRLLQLLEDLPARTPRRTS